MLRKAIESGESRLMICSLGLEVVRLKRQQTENHEAHI
jgi:hypothetical protein